MAIHKPWDRPFFVLGGSVMKNGFSLNLAEGQFGIFNVSKQTPRGTVAAESFKGFPRDNQFELKLGHKNAGGRSLSDKNFSSFPFGLKDVLDVRVSVPKRKDDLVDEIIIGYNGINPDTAIKLIPGDEKEIYIELTGRALEYIGAPEGILGITVPLSAPLELADACNTPAQNLCETVDMLPIITGAVDYIKSYEYKGVPITEFMEVTPVIELAGLNRTGTTTSTLYTLQVCDTGDAGALALVQQQYGDLQVIRIARKGPISTYQVAKLSATTTPAPLPAAYTQSIASIMKGCEDCPAGFSELPGGFLYAVSLEDDGIDRTSVVQGLPGAVAGTAVKADGQEFGVGFYTVVIDEKLEDDALEAFLTANPTAIVEFVDAIQPICENSTVTTAAWVAGESVTASTQSYIIELPDGECGQSRLTELQTAYPNLVITATGVTGGCQTQYQTTVPTNFLGEECDEIFVDTFRSEAPESFDGYKWRANYAEVDGTDGLYGIRLKGKKFKLASGEVFRDQIGYTEDSVKIQASGGYIRDFNLGVQNQRNIKDTPYAVTRLSNWTPRTHVAGNMLDMEKESRTFFSGMHIDYDYMGRILTNNESNLIDLDAQLADYVISLKRTNFSQGLSSVKEEYIDFHVQVEVGRHQDVEDVLNALAAGAGLPGVQAFGNVAVE